ncbi:MAG TPA: plastocyanin/azurin family copper-binding protein [Gaiellaceae bacterium]|nr:plastocyanin/azurin family copper-binding protein [Gaiellaceae bacterium]
MTRRLVPPLLVLVALVLALAACGGGGESSSTTPAAGGATTGGGGGGGSTVNISADPSGAFKFQQTEVSANAGAVTIDFTNESPIAHDVRIEGNGVEDEGTDEITSSSTTATVDLQPGTYTFFCSVDGHRAAGMEGTLVVK